LVYTKVRRLPRAFPPARLLELLQSRTRLLPRLSSSEVGSRASCVAFTTGQQQRGSSYTMRAFSDLLFFFLCFLPSPTLLRAHRKLARDSGPSPSCWFRVLRYPQSTTMMHHRPRRSSNRNSSNVIKPG
jgi:hypothetical protein